MKLGIQTGFITSVLLCVWAIMIGVVHAEETPRLLLANKYRQGVDIRDYWVSEKLDGVRAYWDGEQLLSRQGNVFSAPIWFTSGLPSVPLDGELWIGRKQFEATLSAVSKQIPNDAQWEKINYMLFELPEAKGTFTERLQVLEQLVMNANVAYLRLIHQTRVDDDKNLQALLDDVLDKGGEGLMLHRAEALYQSGRSNDLLKLKKHDDAEAIVIAHLEGKGKYVGKLGALLLRTPEGLEFKVGSGFSDVQRDNPPKLGCQVTYKFYGLTRRGVPRFASFLRKAPRDPNPECH